MNRRSFIHLATPLILYGCGNRKINKKEPENFIMTVNGTVAVDAMGLTLTHEHLFSIFGLDAEEKPEYNIDELESTVLPFLQQAKSAGCKTIIEFGI